MEANKIESGTIDDINYSAFQFEIYVNYEQLEFLFQYELNGPEGVRRLNLSETASELFEQSGWFRYEQSIYITPGEDWPAGEYTAEVTIRDEIGGEVSGTESTTFPLE